MTSNTSSLRQLYATPANAWSFVPPSDNSSSPYPSSSSSTSYQWSTHPSQNPFFDLSTSLSADDSGLPVNVTVLAKGVLATVLLQYTTSALSMPWEVGKTLLQVQWVPRDAEIGVTPSVEVSDEDEEEELSDSSNDNDSYFTDPTNPSPTRRPLRQSDENGYVVRQSVLDEDTLPEYIIPVGTADGVWSMIKRVGSFRSEGWLCLWKGLLTTTVMEIIGGSLQPTIYSVLQSMMSTVIPSLASPLSPSGPSIILPVASQVITGFIVSPLDLVRTRLMIQSSHPRHRNYSGPIDALLQILTHEGGIKGVYLHPHLLIPTLLDCTLRAVIPLTLPGIVASYIGLGAHIMPETHPLLWQVAELMGSCAGLLITVPFETVRRRLQAQVRGTAKPIRACVELRPAPYNGVVDAFWHILTEERSDLPLKRRRRRRASTAKGKDKAKRSAAVTEDESILENGDSWLRNSGIGQLYRGLGMRISASAIVFVLALLSGGEEADAGWAEL